MGLALASWLGRSFGARLLLTARTPLPARDAWDAWLAAHPADERNAAAILAIRAIEAAGGEVLVAQADAGRRNGDGRSDRRPPASASARCMA